MTAAQHFSFKFSKMPIPGTVRAMPYFRSLYANLKIVATPKPLSPNVDRDQLFTLELPSLLHAGLLLVHLPFNIYLLDPYQF